MLQTQRERATRRERADITHMRRMERVISRLEKVR